MIKAIIELKENPSKELKKELSIFDDISYNDNKAVLRYNNTHTHDIISEYYGLSSGEMHVINTLGKISKEHNLKITFWAQ